jgi:ketosteroid isomerase-like protein
MLRNRYLLAPALGAGLLCVASLASAAEPQPNPIANDFVAAVNAKDLKRVDSLLASDFVMPQRSADCPKEQTDRQCMLDHVQRTLFKQNAKLTLGMVKTEREITRANVTVTSKAIKSAGASKIEVTKEFITTPDGKIQSLITTLRTEDPETAKYKKRTSS